jgi:hypothetical protein
MIECGPMLVNHRLDAWLERSPSLLDSQPKADELFVQCCVIRVDLDRLEKTPECKYEFV